MQSFINGVRIATIASVVSSKVRSIEDETSLFGNDPVRVRRLKKDIGIDRRHITLKEECASDLCEHAARFLFLLFAYDPSIIDCLMMVTQTPDYFQPATSCVLHERLGLRENCAAVAPLFEDAGPATILENGEEDHTITFALHSDGKSHKHLIISFYLNGKAVDLFLHFWRT